MKSLFAFDNPFFNCEPIPIAWDKCPITTECDPDNLMRFNILTSEKLEPLDISLIDSTLVRHKKQSLKWISLDGAMVSLFKSEYGVGIAFKKNAKLITLFGDGRSLLEKVKYFTIQVNFTEQYQLINKIGEGRNSEVISIPNQIFRVVSKYDSTQYAAKIYKKEEFTQQSKKQIRNYIKIMQQIQYGQIVKLEGVFETKNQVIIIMELFNNIDLHQGFLLKEPISEANTKIIIKQLLQIAAYLKKKGIIHRNLGPSNLIFRNQHFEDVCLSNISQAQFYNEWGNYSDLELNQIGFIAPEILHNQNYDYQVDIYSIGTIMYYLLTGHSPFDASEIDQIKLNNYLGFVDYENISMTDSALDILRGLLELNPNKRLTITQALNHQWFSQKQLTRLSSFRTLKQSIHSSKSPRNSLQKLSPLSCPSPTLSSRNSSPNSNYQNQFHVHRVLLKSNFKLHD